MLLVPAKSKRKWTIGFGSSPFTADHLLLVFHSKLWDGEGAPAEHQHIHLQCGDAVSSPIAFWSLICVFRTFIMLRPFVLVSSALLFVNKRVRVHSWLFPAETLTLN